ncbi:MAG: imidazole glycerol phosphate synthase subunit HisH [Ignavibacteriae bacterium]|nr:imidazole glycerol phosphate synthase subunit HisH [Ignavibacteriota bacterium]
MIGIVDYGMGNLLSVKSAFEMIGADVKICKDSNELQNFEKIVLPGVGAFGDCIKNLEEKNFISKLNEEILVKEKPILGICLGMQVMAKTGYEGGNFKGLGWFDADVELLIPNDSNLKIPHIGWNNISYKKDFPLFKNLPSSPDVYFVHSYYMNCENEENICATAEYGGNFTAAVCKKNIFATQFHPEKSQDYGLKILENFIKWTP